MAESVLSVPLLQYDASQAVFASLPEDLSASQLSASLPVPNPTRSFWINTPGANPFAREGSDGELTPDADVCIIGSGITGVSTAWHLAKHFEKNDGQRMQAVILEARDFCSGATGRNGGHLTPAAFLDFTSLAASYGVSEAMKAFKLENHTSDEIIAILKAHGLEANVDLVPGGHTTLFLTHKELDAVRADYKAAKQAGVNLDAHKVEWISKDEMEERYGAPYPGVKFTSHNLWPLKFVTELYKLSKSKSSNFNVTLHTHTPATYIVPATPESGRRWSVVTPRGPLACDYIIHATNAYASYLLPHMSGPSGIIPTRGQIIAVRAGVPLAELGTTSWDSNEGFEYWFPRPINGTDTRNDDKKDSHPLVIIGGGREVTAPNFEYYTTDDSVINKDVSKTLNDFLPGLFPKKYVRGREVEMEWTGIMGYTKTRDPFVGPVLQGTISDSPNITIQKRKKPFEGQFIAAGYSGHGMPRAYACAEAVAGMVTSDILNKEWIAPDWLPEHYLTTKRV
ncbi:FAD dependent oxidoreductase [Cyathus striatus]|nr:FAD dependent oxidoreductase [Cyathus striatus]